MSEKRKPFIGDYSKPVAFPNTAQAKTYRWFLNAVNNLFHLYQTGRMSVGFGGACMRTHWNRTIELKRDYYFNRQSINSIREQLDPLDEKTRTRVYKIDWTPVDFHTKSLNNAFAKITQFHYVPRTTAIDATSMSQKDIKANKAKILANPELKEMANMVGYKDEDDLGLENESDVDIIKELGGFRLKAEIDLKNAVEHSLIDSNFQLVLKEMYIRDMLTENRMFASCEINPHTGRPYVKYVDIANAFYSPSIYPDAHDMTAWGYTESMTIPQLRTWLVKESKRKTDGATKYIDVEKVLWEIATKYKSHYPDNKMPDVGFGSLEAYYEKHGSYPYDHFTVQVAKFGFIASDTQTYVQGVTDEGVFEFIKTNNNKTLDPLEEQKKKLDKVTTQNVYKVRWIVGTDYIFDYGVDDIIAREGKEGSKRAIPNAVVYQNPQTSLIDRIIPKIDEINKCEFKERHILNQMIPQPAMAIDLSLMEQSVTLGGITYNMKEITDFFVKRGIFYYRSKNEFGDDTGSQRPPMEFIKSPEVGQILELANRKALLIQEMKDLIGVNDIADGTQTSAELAVGVNEMSIQAVNNALIPNITAWRQFCNGIGKLLMRQYETMLAAGTKVEGVYFDAGVRKEYALNGIMSDKAEYAFDMELAPTYEDKQFMMRTIEGAYQKGLLSTSEYSVCNNMLRNDDYKAIQLYMAKAEKKKEDLAHQRQMEVTQGQAQAQGDATAKAEEAKMQSQIAINNAESANKLKEIAETHRLKLDEIRLQNGMKIQEQDNDAHNKLVTDTASASVANALQPSVI